MGEEQKGRDYNAEAFGVGAAMLLIAAVLLKYWVVVLLGTAFAVFAIQGAKGSAGLERIRRYAISLCNFSVILFLLAGHALAFFGKKAPFLGFIDTDPGFNLLGSCLKSWNAWIQGFGPFARKFLVTGSTKLADVSAYLWLSLYVAIFGIVVVEIVQLIRQERKAERFSFRSHENQDLNLWFRVGSNPAYLILKYLAFHPGQKGHQYALSLRSKNFWFVKKMAREGMIFLFLALPAVLIRDLTQVQSVVAALLTLPLLSMVVGFMMGLIPDFGDQAAQVLFESPYEGRAGAFAEFIQGKSKPPGGFILGRTYQGKPYRLTERNLNHHIQIVAPSGGGKTNIIKNFIEDRIRQRHAVIFLDYKADFEVAEFIYSVASEAGRAADVRIFSLSNREISVPYNPISHGSAAELQSRLMQAFTWSEPYYRSRAESALLKLFRGLCELRDQGSITITLKTVYDALNKRGLMRELAQKLKAQGGREWEALEDLAQQLDRPTDRKELQGLVTNLEKVIFSGAGELLTTDAENGAYTIDEAMTESRITYFLMNSLSHRETATSVGKLLLQDLMGFVGRAYDRGASGRKPVTIIIDEFAEFAIPEFPSFLNRVRGAGIGVMIAHQTRGDLEAISPDYKNKIEANTNTKIVAGVIDPEDAQFYAQLIGTQTVEKETAQVGESGFLFFRSKVKTGTGSVREVEEFIIHPNRIKKIEQGEALVISRTVDSGFGLLRVMKARSFQGSGISRDQIEHVMRTTRTHYIKFSLLGLRAENKVAAHNSAKELASLWE